MRGPSVHTLQAGSDGSAGAWVSLLSAPHEPREVLVSCAREVEISAFAPDGSTVLGAWRVLAGDPPLSVLCPGTCRLKARRPAGLAGAATLLTQERS